MHLQLSSCVIRSWQPADAEALQRHANNRNIWINLRDAFPHPYTAEDAAWFLNHVAQESPETSFAIATSDEAIGGIGLRLGADVHRKTAELGYWLAEPYWGCGIMSEAVAALTRYAFEAFNLQRVYAEPFAASLASARILQKVGFICEGRMCASVFKDGKLQDAFLYARLRDSQNL
ncbi:MAG: acetyltransferase [Verrucomicrobiaceae bacterium]|nr:acetyltransferase [Verrucomicrobiaceae bacterium]